MIWQTCTKCSTYFADRERRNWCFWCWLDRNHTPKRTR